MDTYLRFSAGVWVVATTCVMLGVDGCFSPAEPLWKRVIWVCALVLQIVATGALLVMHRQDRRSLVEVAALLAVPFLLWVVLERGLDPVDRRLWSLAGTYYLLVTAGGFLVGILGSPLFRVLGSPSPAAVATTAQEVQAGVRTVRDMGLAGFGLLLASGGLVALVLVGGDLGGRFTALAAPWRVLVYLLVLAHLGVVARFTYLHTLFGAVARK